MPNEVVMPRLSDTMEEGTLLRWLKHPGDSIHKGEAIAEVETDKATMEVEAFEDGTMGELLVQEGESVPVGQPIARLNGSGEAAAPESAKVSEKPQAAALETPEAKSQDEQEACHTISEEGPHKLTHLTEWGGQSAQRSCETVLSPSRRREQRETQAGEPDLETRPPVPRTVGPQRIAASPRARKLAEAHGVDLHQLQGSGPEGRIVGTDVESFLAGEQKEPAPEEPSSERPSWMREAIARRMTRSKQEIPHFYITAAVRSDALVRLKKTLQRQFDLSYNDLVLKACALALRRHIRLNSSYRDGNVQPNTQIHIAMAVALPEGLLTPIIHDADELPLQEIARRSRELAARARADELKPEDLTGATFTISNMGMYRLESFTAIINPPQAGILAVGPIRALPVVENGAVIPGYEMRLTLSADHRVINGADAAEFLGALTYLLENPALLSETAGWSKTQA